MTKRTFLVSQAGKPLAYVEADDSDSARIRAKGLGHILDLSPSLPLEAEAVSEAATGIPFFHAEYFELMGFRK